MGAGIVGCGPCAAGRRLDGRRQAPVAVLRPGERHSQRVMAVGATDRWVMTTVFLVVGVCYIVTGAALRPGRLAGRLILITGAATGMLVAVNPQPAIGVSVPHTVWAALGFAGLATCGLGMAARPVGALGPAAQRLPRRRRQSAHPAGMVCRGDIHEGRAAGRGRTRRGRGPGTLPARRCPVLPASPARSPGAWPAPDRAGRRPPRLNSPAGAAGRRCRPRGPGRSSP